MRQIDLVEIGMDEVAADRRTLDLLDDDVAVVELRRTRLKPHQALAALAETRERNSVLLIAIGVALVLGP